MNLKEAYIYMYDLLQSYYLFNKNNELAPVLAGFAINPSPSDRIISDDQAAWYDWIDAVRKVTQNDELNERDTLNAMIILLKEYNDHHGFELSQVIDHFEKQTKPST
jgi:hypothetical protein